MRITGFLRRPLAEVKGALSFVRSSETLDGEDGPRTLVSEGKGGTFGVQVCTASAGIGGQPS
jgi:hypothetical protein